MKYLYSLFSFVLLVGCSEHRLPEQNAAPIVVSAPQKHIKTKTIRIEDKQQFSNKEPDYVYYHIQHFDTTGTVTEELKFDQDSNLRVHFYTERTGDSILTISKEKNSHSGDSLQVKEKQVFVKGNLIYFYNLSSWREEWNHSKLVSVTPLPNIRTYFYTENKLMKQI